MLQSSQNIYVNECNMCSARAVQMAEGLVECEYHTFSTVYSNSYWRSRIPTGDLGNVLNNSKYIYPAPIYNKKRSTQHPYWHTIQESTGSFFSSGWKWEVRPTTSDQNAARVINNDCEGHIYCSNSGSVRDSCLSRLGVNGNLPMVANVKETAETFRPASLSLVCKNLGK